MVQAGSGVLHIILEHFNFEMQYLLDEYQGGDITLKQLVTSCALIDPSGHDIYAMKILLEYSR